MSTRRDAMAALREWSKPGRRAELLAAAWQAGETTISALAEAARISRPTVYTDLRSRGIDPDHRPKEDTMTAPVIDGITGTSLEEIRTLIEDFARTHPGDKAAMDRYVEETQPVFFTLYRYNQVREARADEQRARRECDRALHLVETRWEALNTATAWLAAHHAYTVAVDEARTAIDAWAQAAENARRAGWFEDADEIKIYNQRILSAGHPPVDPFTTDVDAEARQLRADLDREHDHRKELAAQTLRLAQEGA